MSTAFKPRGQLEFALRRPHTLNRHHEEGGRSFYFFDFDDNVMCLPTKIFLRDKSANLAEMAVSTAEFSRLAPSLGRPGRFAHWTVDDCPRTGSFRRFRDAVDLTPKEQPFVEDLRAALEEPNFKWQGPSWKFFWHAVHNQRPLAIITARGHAEQTIVAGLELLRERELLPCSANILSVLAVNHPQTRRLLAADGTAGMSLSVPELKRLSILYAVEAAMDTYGHNVFHRFGMSEDDAKNLELVMAAMVEVKARYPDNAFFVIDSSGETLVRHEILLDGSAEGVRVLEEEFEQLDLF